MRASHNRAVIAARATPSTPNVGAFPFGSLTVVHGTGRIVKSKAAKLTPTQRNSEGRRSEWSASPEFFTDPAWDRTCTS